MTERLYLTNQELDSEIEVLSCLQQEDGHYAIRLSATPFHPQGGGQPSDVGWLGDVEVIRVAIEGNDIVHYTNAPVVLGRRLARVNAQHRQLHSRLHSAGHVIGHVMEYLEWTPIKAHHWPDEGRIVCVPGTVAQELTVEGIQQRCNQLIADDLPCKVSFDGGMRKVAFGHLPSYPCGGTHVASLKQIGKIEIQAVRIKKGEALIRYDVAL